MGTKRKAIEIEVPNENQTEILKITPLGAGNEVGRSCILLEYKGKTIMVNYPFNFKIPLIKKRNIINNEISKFIKKNY